MKPCIIIFNAGSSSLKFSVFDDNKTCLFRGISDNVINSPTLSIKDQSGNKILFKELDKTGHKPATEAIMQWAASMADIRIIAAAHRVVHGGKEFISPVIIDQDVIDKLKDLIPLAPLHQPHNIAAIEAFTDIYPDLPQIACFDTAFHHSQPEIFRDFALPEKYTAEGIIRYGFHGLSYNYIASVMPDYDRVIVAHLGNGASMCALKNRKSVATTMGFTALDGLMMGTRCGNIDPGVILYLMDEKKLTKEQVSNLLYKESGLLGVSGISHDMRDLLNSSDEKAAYTVDLFCYLAAKQLSSLIPSINGVDAIIFTAGIGEGSAIIREKICDKLAWLGANVDKDKNNHNSYEISHKDSEIKIFVIATDEEKVICDAALNIL